MSVVAARLRARTEEGNWRGYGGSRLTTDLMVPAQRLLMQPIVDHHSFLLIG